MKTIIILILTTMLITPVFSQESGSLSELKAKVNISKTENTGFGLAKVQEEKSAFLAFVYSFLLPGMGELYLGRYDVGQYFTSVDGALWLTLGGFGYYSKIQKDNYKAFAVQNAGIKPDGKNSDYFADISNYNSIEDYNTEKYLNREFDKVLDVNSNYWKWESRDIRREYRNMWQSSERASINMTFAIAGLVINRLLSGINAVIMTANYNESVNQSEIKVNSNIDYNSRLSTHFINLSVTCPF